MDYYFLKKNENALESFLMYIISTLFFFLVILINNNQVPTVALMLYILTVLFAYSNNNDKSSRTKIINILEVCLFVIFIFLFVDWVWGYQIIDIQFEINDNRMLVLTTFLYVYLTYKMIRGNSEIFVFQKSPYLRINSSDKPNYLKMDLLKIEWVI
ncbi:hypothetical protein V7O61_07255 [Methanolobus sp. WCC1]|uniref:hypothetical protein n=1 Tax=Methanolobus sp. WCC1 TaxID=3125782 RepID=UPI00324A9A06